MRFLVLVYHAVKFPSIELDHISLSQDGAQPQDRHLITNT